MNQNQIKGRAEQAKGKVKEVVGRIVGNRELGKVQNAGGKVKAGYADLKEDVKDAI